MEHIEGILVLGALGDGKSTLLNSLLGTVTGQFETGYAGRGMDKMVVEREWRNAPELHTREGIRRVFRLIDTPGFGDADISTEALLGMLEEKLSRTKIYAIIVTSRIDVPRVNGDVMRVVGQLIRKGFVQGGSVDENWKRVILVGTWRDRAESKYVDGFYPNKVKVFFRDAKDQSGAYCMAGKGEDGRVVCPELIERLKALKDLKPVGLNMDCFNSMAPNEAITSQQRKLAAGLRHITWATSKDMSPTELQKALGLVSPTEEKFANKFQPQCYDFLQVHNQVGMDDQGKEELLAATWKHNGGRKVLFQTWRRRRLGGYVKYVKVQSVWLPAHDEKITVEMVEDTVNVDDKQDHRVVLNHRGRELLTSLCFGNDLGSAKAWFASLESCGMPKAGLSQSRLAAPCQADQAAIPQKNFKCCCSLM